MAETIPLEYCLLWIPHWSTCMSKSEWSGWMQAIFSVVAIWAAIGISASQQKQESGRLVAERLNRANVVKMSVWLELWETEGVLARMKRRWTEEIAAYSALQYPAADLARLERLRFPSEDQAVTLSFFWQWPVSSLVLARQQASHLRVLVEQHIRYIEEGCVTHEDLLGLQEIILEVFKYTHEGYEGLGGKETGQP